ncbi:MAG: aliphatic sulfonate ABC transporter substrate-binding protein [Potamolinea sp.]
MKIRQPGTLILLVLFVISLGVTLLLASCTSDNSINSNAQTKNSQLNQIKVVKIGYQPHGTFLFLKARGNLENNLSTRGIYVEWQEFSAGPLMLAAMGEGKIDLGYGGIVPLVFAQANDVPFVYVASDSASIGSMAIIVPKNSPIKKLTDLKNKKIAATKGTASHYLLVRALMKAGLTPQDIEFVDLLPEKGQEAFKQKEVDAWVAWNPFLAQVQENTPIRLLTNAEGLISDRSFYFATSSFAKNHGDIIKIVIEEANQVGIWVATHPEEAAKIMTNSTGMNPTLALKAAKSRRYEALQIQDRAIEEQQRVAETFFRLGLLPKRIWVEDAVWKQGFSN